MQKQTLIMAGLCFLMNSMLFANPDAKSTEMTSGAIVRANSPQVKTASLSAIERGEVEHTIEAHKAINTLSWQTKAAGLTGFMGMVVTLAVYVRLY
jgi:hypothetical protein